MRSAAPPPRWPTALYNRRWLCQECSCDRWPRRPGFLTWRVAMNGMTSCLAGLRRYMMSCNRKEVKHLVGDTDTRSVYFADGDGNVRCRTARLIFCDFVVCFRRDGNCHLSKPSIFRSRLSCRSPPALSERIETYVLEEVRRLKWLRSSALMSIALQGQTETVCSDP